MMTAQAYEPERARQLRILLWVMIAMATALALIAALFLLVGGVDLGQVLLVLVAPAALLLGLSSWSLRLVGEESAAARPVLSATAVAGILVGLLLSRTGPGLLVGVVGILLLLVTLLPGRRAGGS